MRRLNFRSAANYGLLSSRRRQGLRARLDVGPETRPRTDDRRRRRLMPISRRRLSRDRSPTGSDSRCARSREEFWTKIILPSGRRQPN